MSNNPSTGPRPAADLGSGGEPEDRVSAGGPDDPADTGGAADRSADGPLSRGYRALTLTLVGLISIVAFEGLAVSTVMPTIAADLEASAGYALAFSAMFTAQLLGIVVAGAWIDRQGAMPAMMWGQGLFGLGCLLAGMASTLPVFLLGRVVTGLGGGLVVVALYVVIGGSYPPRLRPRVFAWISAAWVLPSIVGPLLAASISSLWSWRGVFLLVVPAVGATLAALFARRELVRSAATRPDTSAEGLRGHLRVAWLGLVIALGAGTFQWAGTTLVPPRPLPVAAVVVGLALLAIGVPRILPRGTLRLWRGLPSVIAARALLTATFSGAISFVPLMLVTQRSLSEAMAGAILALASLGWTFGAWVQGRPRLLGRGAGLVLVGAACAAAGSALYSLVALGSWPLPIMLAATVLIGLGMGLGTTATSVLMLEIAPPSEHASASSALTLADTLGSVMGISVTGTIYASLTGRPDLAFGLVWAAAAAFTVVGVVAGRRVSTA